MNGANPPLIMVHGWGGSHFSTWQRPGIEQLVNEAGKTVIGVDLLGHGTSEKPHDPSAYADLSAPVRKAIGSRTSAVDAVGFSLGAIALLEAASHNQKCFRKLMLIGVGDQILAPHDPVLTDRLISGLDDDIQSNDVLARQFGNYARRDDNDPLALRASLMRPRRDPFTIDELKSIEAEIVLAVGDQDFVLPAENLHGSFTNCRFLNLRNCDHFASTENFQMIDALLEFICDN